MREFLERLRAPTTLWFKKWFWIMATFSGTLTSACSLALAQYRDQINHNTEEALQIGLGIGIFAGIISPIFKTAIDWDKVKADQIPSVEIPENVKIRN